MRRNNTKNAYLNSYIDNTERVAEKLDARGKINPKRKQVMATPPPRARVDGYKHMTKEVMAGIEREVREIEKSENDDVISDNYLNLVNFYILGTTERRI